LSRLIGAGIARLIAVLLARIAYTQCGPDQTAEWKSLWQGMISQPLKGLLFQLIGYGTTCKECYEVYEYQGAYVKKIKKKDF